MNAWWHCKLLCLVEQVFRVWDLSSRPCPQGCMVQVDARRQCRAARHAVRSAVHGWPSAYVWICVVAKSSAAF